MNEDLKQLNQNQRQAVLSKSHKILVMAGAGSGKTKVLTTRIKYLLNQGASASSICAFTFTNKAAREMKWRLQAMLKQPPEFNNLATPTISTFHSYCYSFICEPEFYYKLGFTKRPDVISEAQKSDIIQAILEEYQESYSNIPFVKAISKIKNKVKPTDISPHDDALLNTVYHHYQEKLIRSNSIDFDDMIPLFLKLCEEKEIFNLVQTKYVLIDECQDTNQIQYELIKVLSHQYNNVFMVGDEDQLIYSFRNSDISILRDYEKQADEIIILNQNYRSNQEILKYANRLIEFNPSRLKKELFSTIDSLNKVKFKEFTSTSEEALYIVNKIKEFLKEGIELSKIAVLYRNNTQCYPIEKELNHLKIPYTLCGGKPFFEYKEIKTLIYAYRFLLNPKNEIAFANIYRQHSARIETYEYVAFMKDYKQQNQTIIAHCLNYEANPKFQKLGTDLLKLQSSMQQLPSDNFFMELLRTLHFNSYLKESHQQKPQYARIMVLKDRIRDLNPYELEDSLNQMILDNLLIPSRNTISLLTIHKSKGLEFEVVFVIGLNEGILPGCNKQLQDLEEERRIAYVAITRAKEQLYLSCSSMHFMNGNIAKLKPSSFLMEAGLKENHLMDFFGNYWYNH